MLGFASLLEGDREDVFQIVVAGIAALLILQMVTWMHVHGGLLRQQLEGSAERAASRRNWWGLLRSQRSLWRGREARRLSSCTAYWLRLLAQAWPQALPPP
jgi:hypothetical protein